MLPEQATSRPVLRDEEPAAREPGPGGLGVTEIAESGCDGDVGCPMLAEAPCIALPNVDSVKIGLPAKARPVKLNIDIVNIWNEQQ